MSPPSENQKLQQNILLKESEQAVSPVPFLLVFLRDGGCGSLVSGMFVYHVELKDSSHL